MTDRALFSLDTPQKARRLAADLSARGFDVGLEGCVVTATTPDGWTGTSSADVAVQGHGAVLVESDDATTGGPA